MERLHDTERAASEMGEAPPLSLHQDFGDDWVHEAIALTRPGIEIQFPMRSIDERKIPFVYDDFR